MLISKQAFTICFSMIISILSFNIYSYNFELGDITIVAPKFIIGNNQKYQTQIKNVVLNRFEEIFQMKQSELKDEYVITEFFDYTCGHCKNMTKILNDIREEKENLTLVYKQFPIRGNKARLAARAAIASKSQNQYHAFHKLLMQNQPLNKQSILKKADLLNLDLERLVTDMESKTTYTEISDNYGLAQALKITGTPTFIILGKHSNGNPHIFYVAGILKHEELKQLLR